MQLKTPKNDANYHWTQHVGRKMLHYGLSADRVKRVIRNPSRAEEGVAPGTVAVMQPAGSKQKPTEVWVMYRQEAAKMLGKGKNMIALPGKRIIITAWRYPAISKVRSQIPIPAEILRELEAENLI